MSEMIHGRIALAVGAVDRQLERTSERIGAARTYASVGKTDEARFVYREAWREAKQLVTRLRKVDGALKRNRFLVPPGAPFKVVK